MPNWPARIGPRLADPERRLDHRHHAGARHGLVVGGGARDHVRMRIDEHDAGCSWHHVSLCVGLKPRCAVLAPQRQTCAAARAKEFGAILRLARSCGSFGGGKLLGHAAPPFLLLLVAFAA